MPVEIERKFLIKNEDWKKAVQKEFTIKQGYLNGHPERTVRVRIKGAKGFLTIKGKTVNATRAEYEYEIPLQDAQEMIELCKKPVIEKIRYIIQHDKHVWELDVFEGDNLGLVLAEIELSDEAEAFELPSWAGVEVTSDARYYNSNLAKEPFGEWGE